MQTLMPHDDNDSSVRAYLPGAVRLLTSTLSKRRETPQHLTEECLDFSVIFNGRDDT